MEDFYTGKYEMDIIMSSLIKYWKLRTFFLDLILKIYFGSFNTTKSEFMITYFNSTFLSIESINLNFNIETDSKTCLSLNFNTAYGFRDHFVSKF